MGFSGFSGGLLENRFKRRMKHTEVKARIDFGPLCADKSPLLHFSHFLQTLFNSPNFPVILRAVTKVIL
jgi:hypothetical protein